jgi:hypothetical protein
MRKDQDSSTIIRQIKGMNVHKQQSAEGGGDSWKPPTKQSG